VDFVPDTYVNEAVAEGLATRTAPGERLLIFRAQEARDVLQDVLRAAGRTVDAVAAYKTRYVDDPDLRAKAERADIVTFTSASTVHGFVHNVEDAATLLAGKTVTAIGPITAAAARKLGIRVDVVADEFTVEGLLHALEGGATV
jgi:uroporphyrinogen-III synthase